MKGQFGPWRAVWLVCGLGALNLVASAKLLLVDQAPGIAAYPAAGAVGFALVAGLLWRRSGMFRITRAAIHAQRRAGQPIEIPISDIRSIETGTNKLPRLVITHQGGRARLGGISARGKAIAVLRSLGVPLS